MKTIVTFIVCLGFQIMAIAQDADKAGALSKKESMRLAKLEARGFYPVIKLSKLSGVLPVEGINERPDTTLKYKLVISLTNGTKDPKKVADLNRGLIEVGRFVNLHVGAGIPKQNLDVVVVAHGMALFALLNNEAFKKEFKADNPNLQLIDELEKAGVKFVACGQAMQFLDIEKNGLANGIKTAFAARVELSSYQLKGYALYEIGED